MKKRFLDRLTTCAIILALGLCVSFLRPAPANAQCTGCVETQCEAAKARLPTIHDRYEVQILQSWIDDFSCYRSWLVDDPSPGCSPTEDANGQEVPKFFSETVLPAMMGMAEELTAVGMQQIFNIGKFIDAENQMETQRRFQELQFQAHKDYQPSEDFCRIGTNARSLADSEQKAHYNKAAMNSGQMARHLGQSSTIGADSPDYDLYSRWKNFQQYYCDPKDNAWSQNETGLYYACGNINTPRQPKRANIDVDYTRLLGQSRTLDIDLTNETITDDEIDLAALSHNLYGHDILTRQFTKTALKRDAAQHEYMKIRSIAAKRNVAQSSFNAIAALKSKGSSALNQTDGAAPYMHRVFEEFGVSNKEAKEMIGENPSYYAQLEILSKKLYQNSNFFSNLYDKPANIQRKSVALKAIDLMLDRSVFESELRQEMILSVLLAARQDEKFQAVEASLGITTDKAGN